MLAVLIIGSLALADVVGPDRTDCPPGSEARTNHNGSYCTPTTCDGACPIEGETCVPTGLCVLEEERFCGGRSDPNDPCKYTHIEATGTCTGSDVCDDGNPCVTEARCVPPAPPPAAGMCGCSTSSGFPAMMFLIGLFPLAIRRMRSASGSPSAGSPEREE